MSKFSNRLKQLRKENNLTQKQLADILHVSQNAIYNWENEKREPSLEMLNKIAAYFNVSLDYLMVEKENKLIIKANDPTLHSAMSKIATSDIFCSFVDINKIVCDILGEKIRQEEMEELNRRLHEKLPTGNYKISDVVSHFGNDEYTKEEMQKIEEFAQFIKSQRKKIIE